MGFCIHQYARSFIKIICAMMKINSIIILAIPTAQYLTFIQKIIQDNEKQVVIVGDEIIRHRNCELCCNSDSSIVWVFSMHRDERNEGCSAICSPEQ